MTKSKAQAALDAAKKLGETKVQPKRTFKCLNKNVSKYNLLAQRYKTKLDIVRGVNKGVLLTLLMLYYESRAHKYQYKLWQLVYKEFPAVKGSNYSVDQDGIVTQVG